MREDDDTWKHAVSPLVAKPERRKGRHPLGFSVLRATDRDQKADPPRPPPDLAGSISNAGDVMLFDLPPLLSLNVEIVRKIIMRIIVGAIH